MTGRVSDSCDQPAMVEIWLTGIVAAFWRSIFIFLTCQERSGRRQIAFWRAALGNVTLAMYLWGTWLIRELWGPENPRFHPFLPDCLCCWSVPQRPAHTDGRPPAAAGTTALCCLVPSPGGLRSKRQALLTIASIYWTLNTNQTLFSSPHAQLLLLSNPWSRYYYLHFIQKQTRKG